MRKQESQRWKNCTDFITVHLQMAAVALFVREHFDVTDKQKAIDLIQNVRNAFLEMINQTDWMDKQTKEKATVKVGIRLATLRLFYSTRYSI
jgi:membrane metallo-endopeptidase-like protein 1